MCVCVCLVCALARNFMDFSHLCWSLEPITCSDAGTAFNIGMVAVSRTYSTTQYILLAKVSQTNTRWLFCSWMGRPGSVAGGQWRRRRRKEVGGRRGGSARSGSGSGSAPLRAPAWPRGLPVCAPLHAPPPSQRSSLSPGWGATFLPPYVTVHTHHTDQIYSVGWEKKKGRVFTYYIIMSQGKQFGTVTGGSGVAKTRVFIFHCVDDWHKSPDYSGWLLLCLLAASLMILD